MKGIIQLKENGSYLANINGTNDDLYENHKLRMLRIFSVNIP